MKARARVIIDNDFGGNPDGLLQLAHHLLSPSVEVPFIVVSRLPEMGPGHEGAIARGVDEVNLILDLMESAVPVLSGADAALQASLTPALSPAGEAIIREAMRDDTELPLYYAAGGGLTELASVLRHEPRVAERLTLVWIGGDPYTVPRRPDARPEFNTMVDFVAAQVVFSSEVPIWQVPQNVYSQALVSLAELDVRIGATGALGAHLVSRIRGFADMLSSQFNLNLGETCILGDNPLVLLTALQSSFGADPETSTSETRARPILGADGSYVGEEKSLPKIRVFTRLDTRLMLGDMFAKFAALAR